MHHKNANILHLSTDNCLSNTQLPGNTTVQHPRIWWNWSVKTIRLVTWVCVQSKLDLSISWQYTEHITEMRKLNTYIEIKQKTFCHLLDINQFYLTCDWGIRPFQTESSENEDVQWRSPGCHFFTFRVMTSWVSLSSNDGEAVTGRSFREAFSCWRLLTLLWRSRTEDSKDSTYYKVKGPNNIRSRIS